MSSLAQKSMPSHTGADQVADALLALNVRHVFAIASVHNIPIINAVDQAGIKVIMVRHEQNAVHAADAYSRVSGALGVAIVSTGPGTANAMGGMFEANYNGSSVLLITAQVPIAYYGATAGYVHEAEHQVAMLETVTRSTHSVRRACDVAEIVMRAGTSALRAPFRPAAVEVPIDLQYQEAPKSTHRPVIFPVSQPTAETVSRFAELLSSSRRPVVWVGAGVYEFRAQGRSRAIY